MRRRLLWDRRCDAAACLASALEGFVRSRNESSTTSKLACSAACSTFALVTFNTASSHSLSVESVYDEHVAIDSFKDTLEASSSLGPKCSVAAYPATTLEDFMKDTTATQVTGRH